MCFGSDCGLKQMCFETNFIFSSNFLLDKTKLSKKLNKKLIYFLLIKKKKKIKIRNYCTLRSNYLLK